MKRILAIILLVSLTLSLVGCGRGTATETKKDGNVIENNNVNSENNTEEKSRNTEVSDNFTYEHCSFWIDEEESEYFTFKGNDRIKFRSIANYGWHTTGTYKSCEDGIAERGISVLVDGKYVVVVSNETLRGGCWSGRLSERDKIPVKNNRDLDIYYSGGDDYKYTTIIDGKKVNLYTDAVYFEDVEDNFVEFMCDIFLEVEKTIIPYDGSSFAIDNVAQNEFTYYGLVVNSYKNVGFFIKRDYSKRGSVFELDAGLLEGEHFLGVDFIREGYKELPGNKKLTIMVDSFAEGASKTDRLMFREFTKSFPYEDNQSESEQFLDYGYDSISKIFNIEYNPEN